MIFRTTIHAWIRSLGPCLLCLLASGISGQSRTELEARRLQLQKQITLTQSLIKTTRKTTRQSLENLSTIKAQIKLREELIATTTAEVRFLGRQIQREERTLAELQRALEDLKIKYGAILRSAYRNTLQSHPLQFILSAKNLNAAYSRWNYLQQLKAFQTKNRDRLVAMQDSVALQIRRISASKAEKDALLSNEKREREKLERTRGELASTIRSLRSKEEELRSKLNQQEAERKALNAEIERIINAEIAASASAAELPNAPALARLSANFQENKGKIPWPVEKGVITGKFGEQPHPVIKSLKVRNNGIDISVPPDSDIRTVFSGKVVGKQFIPGYQNMLIIQHGAFYTVYSRLSKVYVDKDDEVTTQQRIGRINTDGDGPAKLHFEIWNGKNQLNPELWIRR